MFKMRNKRGMTLVEVLSVVAIISMLMVIIVPNVNKMFVSAKTDATANDLKMANSAVQKYYTENPSGQLTKEELSDYLGYEVEEVTANGSLHKTYQTKTKEDPWGMKYQFYVNNIGTKYVIMHSYGANSEKEVDVETNEVGDDILFVYYPEN